VVADATPMKPNKLFRHPGRVAVVVVALVVVLNLLVFLLASSDTSTPERASLPDAVTSITPTPEGITGPVDDVSVDLRDGLTGVLEIDGIEMPEDQLERIDDLGVITFRPGPDKEVPRFRAGENTVVVRYWDRGAERPTHPPSYSWRFRVAA
jgi:hypothetical protein